MAEKGRKGFEREKGIGESKEKTLKKLSEKKDL